MQLLAHQPVDEIIAVLGTLLCKPDSEAPCFIWTTRARKQNTGVSPDPCKMTLSTRLNLTHHVHDSHVMLQRCCSSVAATECSSSLSPSCRPCVAPELCRLTRGLHCAADFVISRAMIISQ